MSISNECIQCGVCADNCPGNTKVQTGTTPFFAVAGAHIDKNIVNKSSSGGFFSALAEYIICQDGIVFGAVFDDRFKSVSIGNSDEHNLDDLRRSKYTESLVHK